MTSIRLMIVDDHTLFREGMQAIFKTVPEIEVVGETGSGEEAVQQALAIQPDIILMDIQMQPLNGIEACKLILSEQPQIAVIMLTMFEDQELLFAAMAAGAKGYILKGADKAEVLKTIHSVAGGEMTFGAAVASRMSEMFRDLSSAPRITRKPGMPFPELTEREYEILNLMARGLNNQEIADQLELASKTVSNHISNIFNKLQVMDRAQAIVKAREAGMGRTN